VRGDKMGADGWARQDGPVNEGRLVVELDAPYFLSGARQVASSPALLWFFRLSVSGLLRVGAGRPLLSASAVSPMISWLAPRRTLCSRLESQRSVVA